MASSSEHAESATAGTTADPALAEAEGLLAGGDARGALLSVSARKASRADFPDADELRARCFLAMGDKAGAEQAAREALRYDPDHARAAALLAELAGNTPPAGAQAETDPLIDRVRPHTMLGPDRLANLRAMLKIVAGEQIPGSIVECGVAGGGSLALLALESARLGLGERPIYGCDTFAGMPEPEAADTAAGTAAEDTGWGAGTCAASLEAVSRVLAGVGCADRATLIAGRFEDTLAGVADAMRARNERIGLLHCDGDWYSSTKAILENLAPLLAPGACVQIDDYGHWDGCRRAVHEYFDAHGLDLELRPIDYTGRWLRWPGGPTP